MVFKVLLNNLKVVISISVVLVAFKYHNDLKKYYEAFINEVAEDKPGIFTTTKLAQFDGVKQSHLYLAVLGTVFDVTEGKRHYEKGAAYHYFIGKSYFNYYLHAIHKTQSDWNISLCILYNSA